MTQAVRELKERRSQPAGEAPDAWDRPQVSSTVRSRETIDEPGRRNEERPTPVTGELSLLHEAALRALNFVVALAGGVLAAPLIAAIAVAVKLDSRGPVLYRQIRVGVDRRRRGEEKEGGRPSSRRTGDLGGVPFVIYKFRTMRVNAEEGCGPKWAEPEDDRTTRVGRFLRRHRLDELPQLWNVLRGEMAIVGPRPERPLFFQKLREEIARYPRRQTVPPGITGWAQINQDADRCVDDVQQKLRYDLEYLERRSLWFDAWIMLKTPLVMLHRELLSGGDDARDAADYDHQAGSAA